MIVDSVSKSIEERLRAAASRVLEQECERMAVAIADAMAAEVAGIAIRLHGRMSAETMEQDMLITIRVPHANVLAMGARLGAK